MRFSRLVGNVAVPSLAAALLGAHLFGAGNNDSFVTVQKLQQMVQTSSAAPVSFPDAPYGFNVSSPVALSFTPPAGTSTALVLNADSTKYKYSQSYLSQSALDTAFPNGTYALKPSSGSSFNLALTGNLYPNTPQISGGTWNSSGQLVVDSTQSNTISFNLFTGYATAGILGHMSFQLQSFDGSTVSIDAQQFSNTTASAMTSYTLPAGTLQPGSVYEGTIEFTTAVADNTTAISGYTAATIYTTQTYFILVTSGTPANPPVITQQPTNVTTSVGSLVTLSAGTSSGNYQALWFKNGIPLTFGGNGASANLTLSDIQASEAGNYYVILSTNGSGPYVQSNTVSVTVNPANTEISLQKVNQLVQTTTAAPTGFSGGQYEFSGSSAVNMDFTPPGGAGTAFSPDPFGTGYYYFQSYPTQAALDAAFPNGSYKFSILTNPSFTLSLTGNLYPNTPQISGGTWNASGQLVVDATQSNTIQFGTFTNYATAGVLGHVAFYLQSFDGQTVNIEQDAFSNTTATPFSSYTIPAGLLAPGSVYSGEVEFDTATAENTTAIAGYQVYTVYTTQTYFTLVTSGTPSNVPTITQQPVSVTTPLGSTASFTVADSTGNAQVEWFKNGVPITINSYSAAGFAPTLTITNVQNSDAGTYYAVLLNSGSGPFVQSATATLTIGTPAAPTFTLQPASYTFESNSTAVLNALATGAQSYQWWFNGSQLSDGGPISGSAGPTLVISGATSANAGSYYCVATNSVGSTQSSTATLAASTTSDLGRLVNISCRAQVGTGANELIMGYVIGGSGTTGSEPVLIRASGPALTQFGVTGVLVDPQLTLNGASGVLAADSGWAGNAAIASTAAAVGAFAWNSSTSLDSALLSSLSGGSYTAQIAGASGDTGVALAEVYDATPSGTYTAASPRLVNISSRLQVGTGANILITGFVIGGSTAKTVLIRGSGPALTQFGVAGVLPDPQLQLYSGSTLLLSDNGWGGNTQIASIAARVGAFSWGSAATPDSALLVTLAPGAYTAQVSGYSGDTGVALVEVYEVP